MLLEAVCVCLTMSDASLSSLSLLSRLHHTGQGPDREDREQEEVVREGHLADRVHLLLLQVSEAQGLKALRRAAMEAVRVHGERRLFVDRQLEAVVEPAELQHDVARELVRHHVADEPRHVGARKG